MSRTKHCNKIVVSLVAQLIKVPHRKAGFLTYSQVRRFKPCQGNSFGGIQVRLAEWSKATSSTHEPVDVSKTCTWGAEQRTRVHLPPVTHNSNFFCTRPQGKGHTTTPKGEWGAYYLCHSTYAGGYGLRINRQPARLTNGRTYGRTNGRINGRINGQTNGLMDGPTYGPTDASTYGPTD